MRDGVWSCHFLQPGWWFLEEFNPTCDLQEAESDTKVSMQCRWLLHVVSVRREGYSGDGAKASRSADHSREHLALVFLQSTSHKLALGTSIPPLLSCTKGGAQFLAGVPATLREGRRGLAVRLRTSGKLCSCAWAGMGSFEVLPPLPFSSPLGQ